MKLSVSRIFSAFLLVLFIFCSRGTAGQTFSSLSAFTNPPDSVKVHTWWHWMDGNITREGITKDLEAMAEQGIGQATILNIGLLGDRDFGFEEIVFNTPAWYDMFSWALEEAHRTGISIGIHNCGGWSTSGGPWITPEQSMKSYTWTKTIVNAKDRSAIRLREPLAVNDFYRDVAVVAIPSEHPQSSFQEAAPVALLDGESPVDYIYDGSPVSGAKVSKGSVISFTFDRQFETDKISLLPRRLFSWGNPADFWSSYSLQVSDDGKEFREIKAFRIEGLNSVQVINFPETSAKYFRLEIQEISNTDSWIPFFIGECELLKQDEKALFAPVMEHLSEKTGDVKAAAMEDFDPVVSEREISSDFRVIDLGKRMDKNGVLNWKPEKGNWTIIRFGYTTTGSQNSPATPAGTGLECDKMDTVALNKHFDSFPAKLIKEAGAYTGNTFKFMLVDSWEAGFQNWTGKMMEAFEKRRGYSLISYLPVLCGESTGNLLTDNAVLYDFRKTIADLVENNYYRHFGDLLHRHNMEFHAEVIYGETNYPALDILRTTKYVDLPMFEFWSSTNSDQVVRYDASPDIYMNMPVFAATGYEKRAVGAEAYTGMAHYSETPAELKPFGDKAFCSGINQLILHSYVHQPGEDVPGMTLGQFGAHFNRMNTTWTSMGPWMKYHARIQGALQNSTAQQDILYYLGDQLPQGFSLNEKTRPPFGYTYGACNYDILKNRVQVVDGKLVLNGKISYSMLVWQSPLMHYKTLQLIEEMVAAGIRVYGPKPVQMLSMADLKKNQDEFRQLADKLWGKDDADDRAVLSYKEGQVYRGNTLSEVLEAAGIAPDVLTGKEDGEKLQYIHKTSGDMDLYFVMNQQNEVLYREMGFRVGEKIPEIMDPETGEVIQMAVYKREDGYTVLPLQLEAYGSVLVAFKKGEPIEYINSVSRNGNQIFPLSGDETNGLLPMVEIIDGEFVTTLKAAGRYSFTTNRSKEFFVETEEMPAFAIEDFSCTLSFDAAYENGLSEQKQDKLDWLNEADESGVKYFSGRSIYEIQFDFPVNDYRKYDKLYLDIGKFGAVAKVTLNGKEVGNLWKERGNLGVEDLIEKKNTLLVEVSNPYRNRFIGDFVQYGETRNLTSSAPVGNFLHTDTPLRPSGLKGPLVISPEKKMILIEE